MEGAAESCRSQDIGRFETYEWQVADASATTLTPVDLGPVCIDDFLGTYGTCTD